MIERVLAGAMGVGAFGNRFYDYYFHQVPEDALSASEQEFVEGVCEKLDATAESPTPEDRAFGVVARGEFLEWLRVRYADFAAREAS